jgi:osmotically-inducible protein OsmY
MMRQQSSNDSYRQGGAKNMKRIMIIAVAFLISTSFATLVMSQDKPAAAAEKAEKKAAAVKWSGAVVSVDTVTKTVVAKNKKGEMTFDASVAVFPKSIQFEELKAGDRIAVKYEVKDGRNVATVVQAQHAKAKKAKQESTGEYIDDSVITNKVKALLAKDDFLKSFQISVVTFKGNVQLSGFVDSQKAVDTAGEIASSVKGVKSVKNSLVVK